MECYIGVYYLVFYNAVDSSMSLLSHWVLLIIIKMRFEGASKIAEGSRVHALHTYGPEFYLQYQIPLQYCWVLEAPEDYLDFEQCQSDPGNPRAVIKP